jgi:glutamate N-acetyltransferase/amino-acid N-acetyltransferase
MKRPIGVITIPGGFRACGVAAGIKKKPGVPDVALLVCETPASAAGLFTTNRVCAAPVQVSRRHLALNRGRVRAVVVNSGNANACTGARGLADARRMTQLSAQLLHVKPAEVLVASTGVIGHPLPMNKVEAGIREAKASLSAGRKGARDFLRGIMTTDLFPKEAQASVTLSGSRVRIAGVVKGAGMICPNVATMLAFVTTDAGADPKTLDAILREAANHSFNRITVDGHMSTNDTVLLLASGASGATLKAGTTGAKAFAEALTEVMLKLALSIVRDGEGATRVAAVRVTGAASDADAELAARAVAQSPLVKTALYGADPNWGRIVSAAGYSGGRFVEGRTSLAVNGHFIYRLGKPLRASAAVVKAMKGTDVEFVLDLGVGRGKAVVYTCDLGYAYVKLNSAYTT